MREQSQELTARFNAASDQRALALLRDATDREGAAAVECLREALRFVTYLDTLDGIIERAEQVAAGSEGEARQNAERLAGEARRKRERGTRRAEEQDAEAV